MLLAVDVFTSLFFFKQFSAALYLSITRWADENLGQTGLSDTAELLDELVKEGYISQSDLDWTNSQTVHHSRYSTYSNSLLTT